MRCLKLSFTACFLATPALAASSDACNLADVLFGKVRVDLISHGDYETGIIFGNDFDSKRFMYDHILGKIISPERDGSRRITDTNENVCGILYPDGAIDLSESDCPSCDKRAKVRLQKVTKGSFAVISNGSIMGTVDGRLPK